METTAATAATLSWVKDEDPRWDADRRRVFATVPEVVFPSLPRREEEQLPGDWWRVEDGGRVVGYGWLDDVWGDAEILLAVEERARGTGAGAFTLARLEDEAVARGLNYVVNVVRDTHPDRAAVTEWFLAHGFAGTDDGRLRKRVGDRTRDIGQRNEGRPGTGRFEPDGAHRAAYDAERERASARPRTESGQPGGSDIGPGAEESGGYVDVTAHRY
ncbi:GNAT family N-acetyltransferase [Blastococcus saxobsidens]|uniref:Acetyltransferase (GNAT) family protein (Modular protein) n=1 Tax=Blastococcus saxobsidens (strain DD2) TaxID=1146883 RepID=H6RX28_BLASD|nr:GNAT family N-acetyltransferase [Blastococcus saxobsidens]CCG03436.1 Acetyltransferase (GNAT) family protein (modular protein) [Blastococcus saxobsidens DD2]